VVFREVRVFEVREVLRLWLGGEGLRSTERLSGVDRKTVRRYVAAAEQAGLCRSGGERQLDDALLAAVVEAVRPHRSDGHGQTWHDLEVHRDQIKTWLEDDGLTVVKVGTLLSRMGVVVPSRTLTRFATELCGPRRAKPVTVRVNDGDPGQECQVDFGRMGLLYDAVSARRRVVQALIFTAVYSRHCFVWLSFSQTTAAVIEGCEAAWNYFQGVFKILIPDNMAAIVERASPTEARFNQAFVEYAQCRGFLIDPARVRRPTDKPRVERNVSYVRSSFFAGESFIDLDDAQRRAVLWSSTTAGMRIHGTTAVRPAELFALEEAPHLLPVPQTAYDLPIYAKPKVHRDHHIEVARALYSVPGNLIGSYVDVRADRTLVKVFYRSALVKIHPRQAPGSRITDPADLPAERTAYAMRDLEHLRCLATKAGPAIGAYATVLLEHPLPWTKMRQVYALLGLVKKWGPERVETACQRAAQAEAFSVSLIGRMLERATEDLVVENPTVSVSGRFVRPPGAFAVKAKNRPSSDNRETRTDDLSRAGARP
jgi:transposase